MVKRKSLRSPSRSTQSSGKKLTLKKTDKWWLLAAKFAYHEKLKNYLKQFPGVMWYPAEKYWTVPIELVETVTTRAKEMGFEVMR